LPRAAGAAFGGAGLASSGSGQFFIKVWIALWRRNAVALVDGGGHRADSLL